MIELRHLSEYVEQQKFNSMLMQTLGIIDDLKLVEVALASSRSALAGSSACAIQALCLPIQKFLKPGLSRAEIDRLT